MNSHFSGICCVVLTCLTGGGIADGKELDSAAPQRSPAFRLKTIDGGDFDLSARPERQLTVVCFLGTECPVVRLYGPRLESLHQRYASQGVRFIGIDSNRQDSEAEIREYVSSQGLTFAFAKDYDNRVADQYGAVRMSEVFLLDESLTVRYQGRIDDQFQAGVSRDAPSRHDLQVAIDELLAGKPVSVATTVAAGCHIGRLKPQATDSTVSYCDQISRILQKNCVECHQAGEIGPFALTHYDEILGWGDTLVETIDDGRMPPWHANPAHGSFANARIMPAADKQMVRDWVAAGMPYGNADDLPKPSGEMEKSAVPGFDLVLEMRDRPFVVPADAVIDYQYFVVDPQFKEDRWVSAASVIPGNRAVLHHALVFIRPPDGVDLRGVGWLTAYVPGQKGIPLPQGMARRVPAGSRFVFQMHYTPNGTEQTDLTRIAMSFIPAKDVTHEIFSLVAMNQEFEIPPETANVPVRAQVRRIPPRGELLGVAPHMHLRGQSFQVVARSGEQSTILLDVPKYDFNWQHLYAFSTPLNLATVDGLEITARFDNSRANPANPDPSQTVTWGDQTWEEMAIAFFEVAVPLAEDNAKTAKTKPAKSATPVVSPDLEKQVEGFISDFFQRHDHNADGVIERSETSQVFRSYGFTLVDTDRDGKITRKEVETIARRRLRR